MSVDIRKELHTGEARATKRRRQSDTRRRTSLACDTCRKQKEKCEGGQPCWRCQRLDRPCLFSAQSAPRKQSFSAQDISDQGPGSPGKIGCHQQNLEHIVRHFLGDVALDEENVARIAAKCTAETEEMESSLNVNEESFDVHFVSRDVAFYSGEFSHWNFSEKLRRNMRCHRNTADSTVKEYWRATHLQSSVHVITEAITHLPPRQIAEFLVGIFFKYTEVNSFYAERSWIQMKLTICYKYATEYTTGDIPWVCSIFAILAIGTQMAHMEEHKSRPDSSIPEDVAACSEDSIGLEFYRVACRLVPDVILAASYESVQAFLLLATYALPVSTGGLSYTYFGLAMKMAIQNGMHRRYIGHDCDTRTLELRNRLFWTVYTIERRTSIMHGRPASIARSEISADLPTNSPTFDSPNFRNMIAFIDLVSWTGDVAEILAQFKKCPRRLLVEYSTRLMQLKSKIAQWWNSLPANIECRDWNPRGPLFRPNCHLKLCYLSIYIYMGRPFIFNSNIQDTSSEGSPSQSSRNVSQAQRSELVSDCVKSALEILATLESLSSNAGLCRASYTEFSSCRAALLVILAQVINSGMSSELQSGLDCGMILIRQMTGGTSSQSEISYIESIEAAIRQLSSNTESDNQVSALPSGSESAYAKFKDWTQSMKKDKGFGSTVELASFSPMSNLTSGAESTLDSNFHDLNDLFNSDWVSNDLNLDPEVFLNPQT
ncbi:uncharacterized protein N7483_003986 [Penicillium malachiteum]|uniref:uncharacterized protein n=1 Tax=Penicillium malachiteum TaxID=1324776 RepID=UPI002548A299|nr:uncharacterized protein N7483_003986 [Penicillium malachiteum]KAJ5729478.1 hypothetical protein N7483_003986 [Penicillium malachiteum]